MLITREERNLLARVSRHLRAAIEAEERGEGSTPLRDRLLRDERDLGALRIRLEQGEPQRPLVLEDTTLSAPLALGKEE